MAAGFDLLAPHYRWMEWLLAGRKLQRCRTAFLGQLPQPRRTLLLGEGNGRFLAELLRRHPRTKFTCVDSSLRMLECLRIRLARLNLDTAAGEFVHADALDWSPPADRHDLIVSHFFLDCFRPDQLARLVPALARSAVPDARWLLADFCEPPAGWTRWRARAILWSMYLFFRAAARLPATRLTAPDDLLRHAGFALVERRSFDWGLLHSDLWSNAGNNSHKTAC